MFRKRGTTKAKKAKEEIRECVAHVHISDNTGTDEHLPIGLGNRGNLELTPKKAT